MVNILRKLWNDESGQGMVEYGLIIALVSIVVIVALQALGVSLDNIFGEITTELDGAIPDTTTDGT